MDYEIIEVGTLTPGKQQPTAQLRAGEVGYMHGAIKQVRCTHARQGDTICPQRYARTPRRYNLPATMTHPSYRYPSAAHPHWWRTRAPEIQSAAAWGHTRCSLLHSSAHPLLAGDARARGGHHLQQQGG